MDYLTVSQARERDGLRLVLSAHVPGPWGEAAKAVLSARSVAYQPVAQDVFGPNDELYEWTGHRNAPIAIVDSEAPVSGWLDLLMLAESRGTGPSLLPASSVERALCLGLSAEICAPYGFGWERRVLMLRNTFGAKEPPSDTPQSVLAACRRYEYDPAKAAASVRRLIDILDTLKMQLRKQRAEKASPYLVGDQLSACDLYWACFSIMVAPLPADQADMPEGVRTAYGAVDPEVAEAIDPILLEHRDFILRDHIGLPLEF